MPVHQITRFGLVNAYLVEEDDGLTLIDTTVTGGQKPILAAAEKLGKPITRIVLTHAHADHTGALDAVVKAVPDAEVSISARDARLLAGDKTLDAGEAQGKIKGGFAKLKTVPNRTFVAGERIGSLEVVAAPGHTPGQVALLDTRDRTLYCGDAYATVGRVATCAKPAKRFVMPGIATWDKATSLATARTLRALDPARLAPGHGKVVEAPGAAMDAAIAKGA
jgi:glyoxylase-like metal-dependent hydrolase (beta-lactamase superfamily II)